jgi:hypothetical protein
MNPRRKTILRKLSRSAAVALLCSLPLLHPTYGLTRSAGQALEQAPQELNIVPRAESSVDESSDDQAAKPQLGAPKPESGDRGLVGLGIRVSTLGAGAEVATSLTQKLNLRGGFNMFSYNRGFNHDGITYNGQLDLRSGELHLDFYPFGHGFHLSPGLLVYNGNGATANANVPGNSTFSLGGTMYLSDPLNPIAGKGKLDFVKAAPTALLGFGNLVPRTRHFNVNFEMGAVFQGSARTKLNLTGNACLANGTNCVNAATDPTVAANVLAEQTKINNKLSPFKYYPVISIGFGYRF